MEIQKFKEVYDKFFRMVFSVAYRIVRTEQGTEDICQEVFMRLYQHYQRIENPQHMVYWLIRVTKNLALNYAVKAQKEEKVYRRLDNDRVSESAEVQLIRKDEKEMLQKAVMNLPQRYRTVILLKDISSLTYQETAKILQISENNAKVRVFRARQKLAKVLKDKSK